MPKAPRHCPADGCTALITTARRCPDHTTSWSGPRTRSSTVTSTRAWRDLRQRVLKRDHHRCQIRITGVCIGHATVVDHIINTASGGAELDEDNCQSACAPCNAWKASQEGAAARRQRRDERKRQATPLHPGLFR